MSQIKRLVIKDCLGIEELAISPGKINVVSGGSQKGKTSILEAIEKALSNSKRRARFVRLGAEKGYIELETDNGISVQRTIVEDEAGLDIGSVKVVSEGHPVNAPETFLKGLFGAKGKNADIFSFNPVDFMDKKATEQTDILLGLMPIKVTPDDVMHWFGVVPKVYYNKHGLQVLKDLENWFYDARREANTRLKATNDEIVAVEKQLPDNYKVSEWESVSIGDLYVEIKKAEDLNADIANLNDEIKHEANNRENIKAKYNVKRAEYKKAHDEAVDSVKQEKDEKLQELTGRAAQIREEIKALTVRLEEVEKLIQSTKDSFGASEIKRINEEFDNTLQEISAAEAKDLKDLELEVEQNKEFVANNKPVDVVPMRERALEVERMKGFIPLAKEAERLHGKCSKEVAEAKRLDECVQVARIKPKELLSLVKLPIQGLGIDDNSNVTINGLPLSNMSTSEQIRACLDIARELAKDNPLKLICVDRLETLDEDVRAEFLKQVETDEECQYFITLVSKGELKIETRG